jgi:hypothetical protein
MVADRIGRNEREDAACLRQGSLGAVFALLWTLMEPGAAALLCRGGGCEHGENGKRCDRSKQWHGKVLPD